MQSLTVNLTDSEKLAIGNELERLFAAHDRPLSVTRKATLIQELADTGIPIRALSAGLRSLKFEELRSIQLSTMIGAARGFLDRPGDLVPCETCHKTGYVIAKDDNHYQFALACVCANGERYRKQRVKTWNGEKVQSGGHGQLKLHEAFAA